MEGHISSGRSAFLYRFATITLCLPAPTPLGPTIPREVDAFRLFIYTMNTTNDDDVKSEKRQAWLRPIMAPIDKSRLRQIFLNNIAPALEDDRWLQTKSEGIEITE